MQHHPFIICGGTVAGTWIKVFLHSMFLFWHMVELFLKIDGIGTIIITASHCPHIWIFLKIARYCLKLNCLTKISLSIQCLKVWKLLENLHLMHAHSFWAGVFFSWPSAVHGHWWLIPINFADQLPFLPAIDGLSHLEAEKKKHSFLLPLLSRLEGSVLGVIVWSLHRWHKDESIIFL